VEAHQGDCSTAINVVILGPPGAGKGTQAERLSRTRKVPKISTGDILREAVQEETGVGRAAKETMEAGNLVGDDIMIAIVQDRLGRADARCGFVLDGFPRTVVQATALDRMMSDRGPLVVLNMVVPEDVLVRRLATRRICRKCGANAAPDWKAKCGKCGGALITRVDDGIDIVRVQDVGLRTLDDPTVLQWPADEGRVLISRDIKTIPNFAHERVATGLVMPGVLVLAPGVSMAVGAGLGVVFTGFSSHWLFNSALPTWSVKKLGESFDSYLKRKERLISEGRLSDADEERVRFERDIAKRIGAPLLGAFSFASGAVMMTNVLNPKLVTGFPIDWILGGNPALESVWFFANGMVCFKTSYDFFMIALDGHEDVEKLVREVKGLLPQGAV